VSTGLFALQRLPGAMPWTRCGRPYVLITGTAIPLFPLQRLSLPLDDELFRRAIVGPVFISAILASGILAALAYCVATQVMPRPAAGPDLSPNGSVVVLCTSATTLGTGAGTVVEVYGQHVRILTAKHVAVFGALSVRLDPSATVPAQVLTLMAGHDVAIIEAIEPLRVTSGLHAPNLGVARLGQHVVVRGSDAQGGPETNSGVVTQTSGELPDGPANGRFAFSCSLCHRGDSGAGVFDSAGDLVGVYVGYWTYENGERVSIAEIPNAASQAALSTPFSSATTTPFEEPHGSSAAAGQPR
jgi:hypothetical protein